jgi:hypothetical protein
VLKMKPQGLVDEGKDLTDFLLVFSSACIARGSIKFVLCKLP